jgi:hypothetical protein
MGLQKFFPFDFLLEESSPQMSGNESFLCYFLSLKKRFDSQIIKDKKINYSKQGSTKMHRVFVDQFALA